MAEGKTPTGGKDRRYRVHLEGHKREEPRPDVVVTAVDRGSKPLHVAAVDADGGFDIPEDAFKAAHRILIGPKTEEGAETEPRVFLRYRPDQLTEILRATGVLDVPMRYWKRWWGYVTCVTGSVRRCRPRWWWYVDKVRLFNAPELSVHAVSRLAELSESSAARRAVSRSGRASIRAVTEALRPDLDIVPVRPLRCYIVCDGKVEVYRRTCCCHRDWFLDDPRLSDLIRELEDLVSRLPGPIPPLPDPPPDPLFSSRLAELPFLHDGALDERVLNAQRDLRALRSLPGPEVAAYIRARPYLWWCSCSRPTRVAQGVINPDGTFSICWREFPRILRPNCYDQYAYVVRQLINGVWVTIYNGVSANIWFNHSDDADLVSYNPRARVCRDNGAREDAYVYLELVGDTEAWHLKTPDPAGWDRVLAPTSNDGLVFPPGDPDAGSVFDRPWGGTLQLYFKFSEGLRDVGARFYRLSVTEADAFGNPVGSRNYWGDGLSWEKSIGGGVTVPVGLGPQTVGTQNNLYQIPYDADGDWDAGQYHAFLNTNNPLWSDPAQRHLLTLEVFDAAGQRLRPNGTPATGQPGAETQAPFTYRRQFQDLGPTANVPFGALTHLFWWDNQHSQADLESLIKSGLVFNAECQYLQGSAASTLAVGYRAYHPNPQFHHVHSVWWYRGSGATAGSTGTLTVSTVNVGKPPDPAGVSGSNTFAEMLRTDLEPSRLKCSFVVHLNNAVKTFDGENTLTYLDSSDQWAFSVEINA